MRSPRKAPAATGASDEVVALTKDGLHGRDYENGKAMYATTMCATCHRFAGDGGSVGPDLTGAGARYTMRDFMENIVTPSKVISDQYESHEITKKDGSTVIGRVIVEENGKVFVVDQSLRPAGHAGHRRKGNREPQSLRHLDDAARADQCAESKRTARPPRLRDERRERAGSGVPK